MNCLVVITFVVVLLSSAHQQTAHAQTCTNGGLGSCTSGSVSSAPDYCSFDCICSGAGTANVNFEASCNLVRLNDTSYHRNSTFVWFAISTQNKAAEQALLVLNSTGNSSFPAFNWAFNGSVVRTAFAVQLADMTNHSVFQLSVALYNVTKMQTTFTGGAMQCAPTLGGSMYSPTELTGTIAWIPPDTFNESYVVVDLMQRNYTADGSGEWQLLRAGLNPWGGRQFSFPDYQCTPIELAFRSTLNLPAPFTERVRCPEMSSSQLFKVSIAPTQPVVDTIDLTKQANGAYTVNIKWRTSSFSGGCANITYGVAMLSLYVRQWYAETSLSTTDLDAVQFWVIHDADLIPNIQYQVVINTHNAADQAPQVWWKGGVTAHQRKQSIYHPSPLSIFSLNTIFFL